MQDNRKIISNISPLKNKADNLYNVLKSYITNDPEYLKAQANNTEVTRIRIQTFHAYFEGICYLEKYLIPEIYSNK